MTYTMPVGTSEPADFQIFDDGAATDGTGLLVELLLYRAGSLVDQSLTVEWLDQSAGTVRVTGTEDLAVGSYKFRFRLTGGAGSVGFAPNAGASGNWRVTKVQD